MMHARTPRQPALAARLRPVVERFLAARRAYRQHWLPDPRVGGGAAVDAAFAEHERLERAMQEAAYDAAYSIALKLDLDTSIEGDALVAAADPALSPAAVV